MQAVRAAQGGRSAPASAVPPEAAGGEAAGREAGRPEPARPGTADVLVVLPTYEEAATIERVLRLARASLPDAHILVVDDSSPDGTAALARAEGARLGGLSVLERPRRSGLGTAYREGFRWGLSRGYRVLCEMDSDLSHDPSDLCRLVAPVLDGRAQLVIGSRYVPGGAIEEWTLARRAISLLGNRYADVALGLGVRDSTAGFRAYASSLLERLALEEVRADSFGFQVLMTHLARESGASVMEVPIRFVDRREGSSKMSAHTVLEAFWQVSRLGLRRAVRKRGRKDIPWVVGQGV